ncbi:hypothetical protein [Sphingobium sp. AP50]|uniref:hypothetical protein n=1 Tax=Sphingobium sp. AP50 TaxID=1884369 RepID=UPI0011608CD1|nr:hypothetical protein [Sphingobium sp. AP50]
MTVTIALPDAVHGFYRGTRFDWAGMIVEARRQGHRFYGPWFDGIAPNIRDFIDDGHRLIAGPQTAATGPAEEFIDPIPGYNEAPVGGTFLKIGVGRLRKTDALRYSRFRSYAIVDNGSWRVRRTAQTVTFRQMIAPDASGYGYIYEKMVRVRSGGRLEIGHRLVNIGNRPISTQVYNHNFTRFDDRDIGPGVSIDLPYPLPESTATPHLASVKGSTLSYLAPLAAGDHVTLSPNSVTADPGTSGFTIAGPGGMKLRAASDTPIIRAQIWSIRRVVAVEPFIAIQLPAGVEKRWVWRYNLSANGQHRSKNHSEN